MTREQYFAASCEPVAWGMRIWRANGNLYASCARDMSKAACRAGDGGLRIMYGMRDTRRLRTGTTRRKANLRREVIWRGKSPFLESGATNEGL